MFPLLRRVKGTIIWLYKIIWKIWPKIKVMHGRCHRGGGETSTLTNHNGRGRPLQLIFLSILEIWMPKIIQLISLWRSEIFSIASNSIAKLLTGDSTYALLKCHGNSVESILLWFILILWFWFPGFCECRSGGRSVHQSQSQTRTRVRH